MLDPQGPGTAWVRGTLRMNCPLPDGGGARNTTGYRVRVQRLGFRADGAVAGIGAFDIDGAAARHDDERDLYDREADR